MEEIISSKEIQRVLLGRLTIKGFEISAFNLCIRKNADGTFRFHSFRIYLGGDYGNVNVDHDTPSIISILSQVYFKRKIIDYTEMMKGDCFLGLILELGDKLVEDDQEYEVLAQELSLDVED